MEAFLDCPDWYILEICEFFEKQRRQDANLAAYTHAIGWTSLFNGFAGEKAKKSSPQDLLPFPDELRSAEDKNTSRVTEETERVIRRLLKEDRIPPKVKMLLQVLLQ